MSGPGMVGPASSDFWKAPLVFRPDRVELRIANTANDLKDARGFYLILWVQKRALINGRCLKEGLLPHSYCNKLNKTNMLSAKLSREF